jgi:hypothetical protein
LSGPIFASPMPPPSSKARPAAKVVKHVPGRPMQR